MGCGSSNATVTNDPIAHIAKVAGLQRSFVAMYYQRFHDACPGKEMNEQQFVKMFLKLHMQTFNPLLSKFLGRVFILFDIDGNGTVDFIEVITVLHLVVNGSGLQRLGLIFHLCDTDRSKSIEREEFVGTVKDLAAFIPGNYAVNSAVLMTMAQQAFSSMDTSGTGSATFDDYCNAPDQPLMHLVILLLKALVRIVTADPPIPGFTVRFH